LNKKRYVFAANCNGVGISILTDELVESILRQKEVNYILVKPKRVEHRFFRYLVILKEIIYLWWLSVFSPAPLLVVANYFPLPTRSNVVTVLRHPYLLRRNPERSSYFLEQSRRLCFWMTCVFSSKIIVQTPFMYDELKCNKLFGRFVHKTVIVPNPLRNLSHTEIIPILNKKGDRFYQSNKLIIYPSGYYPHKNFEGLVEAILSESDRYVQAGFKFVFCVDALVDFSRPIGGIEKFGDLSTLFPDLFFIVGRVSPQELNYLYANSLAGVFPSENETYGNGLYEMEALGIPFLYNATLPFHPTSSNSYASQFEKGLLFDQIQQLVSIVKKKKVYPNTSTSQMDWLNKLFGDLV